MPQVFPTLVFKCPGPHFGPPGKTYNYAPAKDEAELASLRKGGWFLTLAEACAGKNDEIVDDSAPTRAELEEKAKELAIEFDGRTSDKKLSAKIEEALKPKEAE